MSLRVRAAKVKGRLRASFRKRRRASGFSVKCSDIKANGEDGPQKIKILFINIHFPVALRKANVSSSSSASSLASGGLASKLSCLKRKNLALASALNQKLMECREVEQYNVQLKEENMALSVEMGKMRKRLSDMGKSAGDDEEDEGRGGGIDRAAVEAEFQRRLVVRKELNLFFIVTSLSDRNVCCAGIP